MKNPILTLTQGGLLILALLFSPSLEAAEPEARASAKRPTRQERLLGVLQLTPEQKRQWDAAFVPLNAQAAKRVTQSRQDYETLLLQEGQRTSEKIQRILTKSQWTAYRRFLNEEASRSREIKAARAKRKAATKFQGWPRSLRNVKK